MSDESSTGLPEDQLWKTYREKLIEAVQTVLVPKDIVTEEHLLETLELSGIPRDDCRTLLPRLQLSGLLDSPEPGMWRLMAAPGHEYDYELPKPKSSVEKHVVLGHKPKPWNFGLRVSDKFAQLIAGLREGPYNSRREIGREMKKFKEFEAYSPMSLDRLILRAVDLGIVDDSHEFLYVRRSDEVYLTPLNGAMPTGPAPAHVLSEVAKSEDREVNIAEIWRACVSAVRQFKRTEASVLENCRLKWIEEESKLLAFVPEILSHFIVKLEAIDVWGAVSKLLREALGKNAVVRFIQEESRVDETVAFLVDLQDDLLRAEKPLDQNWIVFVMDRIRLMLKSYTLTKKEKPNGV